MNQTFDLNEALEQIKAGAKINGKDRVLALLIKQLTEATLHAELDVPRDRNGSYEPQIVKKH